MRSALEIANWFIEHGREHELTHLKIQKLLYIGFALHIAAFKEHLFYDPIEAWEYGPVVPTVYHHLRFSGRQTIREPARLLQGLVPQLDSNAANVFKSLAMTLERFGSLSAFELVKWTHEPGGPWDQTYDRSGQRLQEISKSRILGHYRGRFDKPSLAALEPTSGNIPRDTNKRFFSEL